jgi:benzoyl-CoA reductase subunit C
MSCSQSYTEFEQVMQDSRGWLRDWKRKTGKKIVGCFPMYVPEEIIHASGYMHTYLCHPVRVNLDLALKGEIDFLDGLVVADICDQAKRSADVWKLYFPMNIPFFNLMTPVTVSSPASKVHLIRVLEKMKTFMEDLADRKVSDDDLKKSIVVYNHHRSLLKDLYRFRRVNPSSFEAGKVNTIVASSMLMPKDEHGQLLTHYLEAKKMKRIPYNDKVRLVLWGHPCEGMRPGLLNAIEAAGAVVVDDDVFAGGRYFVTPVSEADEPIEALAQAYMDMPPCSCRYNPNSYMGDYLLGLASQSQAQGAILFVPKFCEVYGFDIPNLQASLEKAGLPSLLIEVDQTTTFARTTTMVQAFVERIIL